MKILIVGLGLIGGSYAKALIKNGHIIYGVDTNKNSIDYAIRNGYINEGSTEPCDFIKKSDLIILCLYPNDIISFLVKYEDYFLSNQLITDVCGVKSSFIYNAEKHVGKAFYVSHHPMAGREKIGIAYADESIFVGANFLICKTNNTLEKGVSILKSIARDLHFGSIDVISVEYHDEMISFTSQLTHALAVSLVNSDSHVDTKYFIGDSYRDLTRIAMINEKLWSQLFLENKSFLLEKLENFEKELNKIKDCLRGDDIERLQELFKQSTKKRKEMEK